MGAIADMTIEAYAMESAVLRAQKIVETKGEAGAALPIAMTRVYLSQAMEKVESAARKVIAAVADGDMLRTQLAHPAPACEIRTVQHHRTAAADRAEDDRARQVHAGVRNLEN